MSVAHILFKVDPLSNNCIELLYVIEFSTITKTFWLVNIHTIPKIKQMWIPNCLCMKFTNNKLMEILYHILCNIFSLMYEIGIIINNEYLVFFLNNASNDLQIFLFVSNFLIPCSISQDIEYRKYNTSQEFSILNLFVYFRLCDLFFCQIPKILFCR